MNQLAPFMPQISRYSLIDVLLTDIAVRIQLTPTEYLTAQEHYRVMGDWVDRPASPLHGRVLEFYPQGGFSTGSTIAAHSERSDFDLDAMMAVDWSASIDPETALATTHDAIAGERGSRYHDKAERKTRCTQIHYDGMHLDVTPSVLLSRSLPKTSNIFHSKPSDPNEPRKTLFANPYGLAQWFNDRVLPNEAYGLFFEDRSLTFDRARLMELRADTSPVPEQLPAYRKSIQVICLQLIKRWRNIAYERRHKRLRLPPSVLLTYYVGQHTNSPRSLIDELLYQVEAIISELEYAIDNGKLVYETNPRCERDVLTDRWPGDAHNQAIFLTELHDFARDLRRLKNGLPLAEMRQVLQRLFGEKPAGDAVAAASKQFADDNAVGKGVYVPGTGAVPILGAIAAPTYARAMPKSSPFGE